MKYDQVKKALQDAAHGWANLLLQQHPSEHEAIAASMEVISEALASSRTEGDLLSHLKTVADAFTRDDYVNGIDEDDHSLNKALFCGMLDSVLMSHGSRHHNEEEPRSDGVISLDARRLQRDALSEQLYEAMACIKQYYLFGFDAMGQADNLLLSGIDPRPANAHNYAFYTLQEMHPDLSEHEIEERIPEFLDKMLQRALDDMVYEPMQCNTESAFDAEALPLQSFYLIGKAHEAAMYRTHATGLPEGTDLFDMRYAREMRDMLKDLLKGERYVCETPDQFLGAAHWLLHACEIAQPYRGR